MKSLLIAQLSGRASASSTVSTKTGGRSQSGIESRFVAGLFRRRSKTTAGAGKAEIGVRKGSENEASSGEARSGRRREDERNLMEKAEVEIRRRGFFNCNREYKRAKGLQVQGKLQQRREGKRGVMLVRDTV